MRPRSKWIVHALVSACVALGVAGCGDETSSARANPGVVAHSPVIAQPERADSYPEAQVSGDLTLREGCLFVGPNLVVWPYGATWDDSEDAVTFAAPPFDDAPPARVGSHFDGGGAYYSDDTDFTSWFGEEFGGLIEECQVATNTRNVVYAYPPMQH